MSRKYSAVVSHVQLMRGQRRPNPGTSGTEECTVLTTAKLSLFFKTLRLMIHFHRATIIPVILHFHGATNKYACDIGEIYLLSSFIKLNLVNMDDHF